MARTFTPDEANAVLVELRPVVERMVQHRRNLTAAQRLQTNTQQKTTSVFVQLELNGLARLGTNPVDVFLRNVPGYTTANDPTARPGGETPGAADFFPRF